MNLHSFFCWAFSSYPQPIINYRRRSVTGLSVDAFIINIVGHTCYTLLCIAFLYSETVRAQYRRRWGEDVGDPTVRLNDLAFTVRSVKLSWPTHRGIRCHGSLPPRADGKRMRRMNPTRHMPYSGHALRLHSSIGGGIPSCRRSASPGRCCT